MISSWILIIIAVSLLLFFSVNLHNILHYRRGFTAGTTKTEVDESRGFTVGLAAPGTGVSFL
jgi:hypothetical protein